jgi:Holliday junction resolvase RusA-like endonuclease
MNEFIIEAQLPSLNQYQNACRSHWSKGAGFKKEIETLIGEYIITALLTKRLHRVECACEIHIEWHEATKRRDVDNIQSAQKFILDAIQHYRIIKNDSRKFVKQIHHTVIDDERDFVIVRIEEREKQ